MCVGGSSVSYPEVPSTRDTSNEVIVSNYELSEANKKKNAEIIAAKNKAKSLVDFGNGDDNSPASTGSTGNWNQSNNNSGYQDAKAGFTT